MSEAPFKTSPLGSRTVTVLGNHWPENWLWAGFKWDTAELRSGGQWASDYHLAVPWAHPDDRAATNDHPDMFGIYKLRLKRGWNSFVKEGEQWLVSKAPTP